MQNEFYKMIIIDDEPLIREGLSRFLKWENYKINISGQCDNGRDALDLSMRIKPDIIVTDIRMPDITGLELIKRLKQQLPDTFFIILSGYDDFNYAREAVNLGVFHYLLKPIKRKELIDVIQKCTQKLDQNKRKKEKEELDNKEIKERHELLKEKLLLDIIQDNQNISLNKIQLNGLGFDLANQSYAGMIIKYNMDNKKVKNQIEVLIKNELNQAKNNYSDKDIKLFSASLKSNVYVLISFPYKDLHRIKNTVDSFLNQLLKDINYKVIIGVGHIVHEVDGIKYSFEQAKEALYYRLIYTDKNVFYAEQLKNYEKKPLFISRDIKNKLLQYVEKNDAVKIKKLISSIKEQTLKNQFLSPQRIHSVVYDIVNSCTRYLYEKQVEFKDIYNIEIFSLQFLSTFNTLDEIFDWLTSFITDISLNYNEAINKKPKRIFQEIERYILNNIDKDISLCKIADEFYYNATYLSRLFKQELNKNYSVYLAEVKINYSKNLLLESNIKVSDIGEKVGYKSYKHFESTFKKVTGITPTEFKKIGRHNIDFV